MAQDISDSLPQFTGAFEGFVGTRYLDSGGVPTIGHGFTWYSKTFRSYWQSTRGHKLRAGDTIDKSESLQVLRALLSAEYSPPVFNAANLSQHEHDAATDVCYNCGPGSLKWKWFAALKSGDVATAASRLKKTATTAGGKQLRGLVRRRAAEATLMSTGNYGSFVNPSVSVENVEIKTYQKQLTSLGYYSGEIDGKHGEITEGAVKNFQRKQNLKVDGVVGPATRAALKRAVDASIATKGIPAAGVGGGAADAAVKGSATPHPDLSTSFDVAFDLTSALEIGLIVAAVSFAAFIAWRFRGRILRRRTFA